MSSVVYGTEYKLEGKWVAKDRETAEFGGERVSIEVDDATAPKISYETAGESYYPQTMYSWHEEQLHWEIEDEIFTLHILSGPGKLERPYQKYVTIENAKIEPMERYKSYKRYKLVEITEEELEDTREWYQSVEDKIWCADSQWETLPTKDRIDEDDVTTLPTDENGFMIKGTSLYGYDESIGGPIVNIPNGIKRIKASAFEKRKSITSVHIPDSVSSIGDACFSGCKNLVSVRLPEGLTKINDYMFSGCESLREINLPNTITSIGEDSFASCKSLEDAIMPEALTFIGERAFVDATGLKKITLNGGLKKIEFAAFNNCAALTELYLPASVKEIGLYAFNGCNSIECITVEDGNEVFYSKNNCLIHDENKILLLACNDSVIPDDGSVEGIGELAFSNCKKIESIILPEAIECIDRYAFSGCSSLRSIRLPKSIRRNGPWDSGYGEGLFQDCSSLEYFEVPEWMTKISKSMFSRCESLKEIKIPDSVTTIDCWAFSGCKSLTELVIPKSVTLIGSNWEQSHNDNFIEGCTSLRKLAVEDGNPVFYSKDNCIIETKTGTLFAIAENGVIPNDGSVTKIGEDAFCACENVTEISLPEGVTTIGSNAFSKVKNLKKINIPKSVNTIGSNAFFANWKDYRPDVVEKENGVCYIGNWAVGLVVIKEKRLDSDDLDSPVVSKWRWKKALPESGTITIREGTVGICANAFSSSTIQAVSLPSSLKYICSNAFNSCNNLKSISIPEGVEVIGDYAFNACEELENVDLREGLVRIGASAFNYCQKLKNVTIPHTVKSIGDGAFGFCKGLENLVIPDVEIEISRDAFNCCGDIPNIDISERIRKTIKFSSTDEDEAEYYDEEEYGEEYETSVKEIESDDLPF